MSRGTRTVSSMMRVIARCCTLGLYLLIAYISSLPIKKHHFADGWQSATSYEIVGMIIACGCGIVFLIALHHEQNAKTFGLPTWLVGLLGYFISAIALGVVLGAMAT